MDALGKARFACRLGIAKRRSMQTRKCPQPGAGGTFSPLTLKVASGPFYPAALQYHHIPKCHPTSTSHPQAVPRGKEPASLARKGQPKDRMQLAPGCLVVL